MIMPSCHTVTRKRDGIESEFVKQHRQADDRRGLHHYHWQPPRRGAQLGYHHDARALCSNTTMDADASQQVCYEVCNGIVLNDSNNPSRPVTPSRLEVAWDWDQFNRRATH